jgi:hypothetical protein
MKQGTTEHPKFAAFCLRLGFEQWEGHGLLDSMWHFTARFAPQGDIGRWPDDAIAKGIGYGRPKPAWNEVIQALIGERWLDPVAPPVRLLVHDWSQHAEERVRLLLARAHLFFADGKPPKPNPANLNSEERKKIASFYRRTKAPLAPEIRHGAAMAMPGAAMGPYQSLPSPSFPKDSSEFPESISKPKPESGDPSAPNARAGARPASHDRSPKLRGSSNGRAVPSDANDRESASHQSAKSGNGLDATPGFVIDLWRRQFPGNPVTRPDEEAAFDTNLRGRIAEHPDAGTWLHLVVDQLPRQPYLTRGDGKAKGPISLAKLVGNGRLFHEALHGRYRPEHRSAG